MTLRSFLTISLTIVCILAAGGVGRTRDVGATTLDDWYRSVPESAAVRRLYDAKVNPNHFTLVASDQECVAEPRLARALRHLLHRRAVKPAPHFPYAIATSDLPALFS